MASDALASMLAGKKSSPSGMGGEGSEPSSSSSLAFKSLARAFGIPPERQASAESALKAFVKSCNTDYDTESEDTEEF